MTLHFFSSFFSIDNSAFKLDAHKGKNSNTNKAPWQITITVTNSPLKQECNGAFLNRKFAISRKSCIDNINNNQDQLYIRKNIQNTCQRENQTLIEVKQIHKYQNIVLLEVHKVMLNFILVILGHYRQSL